MAVHSDNESGAKVDNSKELSPVNILSVDFDWIMEPSIEAYNGICDWNKVQEVMPGVTFACDYKKYKQISVVLLNVAKTLISPTRFKWGNNHDSIVSCMRDWGLQKKDYAIYNVDHHHDCGYCKNGQNYANVMKADMDCGNWVLQMQIEFPKMNQYTWINNKNSIKNITDDMRIHLPNLTISSDINVIDFVKFDYIFLSYSPDWIPPQYAPLFETLTFSLDKILNK